MTRDQLVSLTQEYADAVGSPRWTTSNINIHIGQVQWRNQAKLLNANNQFYLNTVTVTQNVSGQFTVASLTTGSGDSAKNFYRVLTLGQPGEPAGTEAIYYREANLVRYPPTQPNNQLSYVWYRSGDNIQILPAQDGQSLVATVNYRPPRANQLSAGSISVDYPDGYEAGLAYEAAAMMLMKGAAESGAARDLMVVAREIFTDMLFDLGRMSTQPKIAMAFDSPADWGG